MKKILFALLLISSGLFAQSKTEVDTSWLLSNKYKTNISGLISYSRLSINKQSKEVLKVTIDNKVFFIPSYFCDCKKCIKFKGFKELKLN